jgi:hypothetical protein
MAAHGFLQDANQPLVQVDFSTAAGTVCAAGTPIHMQPLTTTIVVCHVLLAGSKQAPCAG